MAENKKYEYVCKECGEDFESKNPQSNCASCGSFDIKRV